VSGGRGGPSKPFQTNPFGPTSNNCSDARKDIRSEKLASASEYGFADFAGQPTRSYTALSVDDEQHHLGDDSSQKGMATAFPTGDDQTSVKTRIATLNVGTLTGRSREIMGVMVKRRINALCIQEVMRTGQKIRELGDGYKVTTRGGNSKRNIAGVLLDAQWKSAVVFVVRYSDVLMLVKIAIHWEL
jgi:hypothetical protein